VIYFCAQKNRREQVLQTAGLNGIDYLEVPGEAGCGTQLAVTFLKPAQSLTLTPDNISITGGQPVAVVSISSAATDPTVVTVELDRTGDFSTYTFTLVASHGIADPPDGVDPQLSSINFSFKAGCPTPADCLPTNCCPPARVPPPDINYLAKDYDGFRQVMLDRMATLYPAWTETHAADPGIAIAEALAYAADHLSYQQDAVSTEAYLDTARSRISLRRHARLVDYTIGEGCNARTLVCITAAPDTYDLVLPTGTRFYVRVPGLATAGASNSALAAQLGQLAAQTTPVFTSMQHISLSCDHNDIDFYTWGDTDCCLPPGSTEATLASTRTMLEVGDFLIFEEVLGPRTGQPEDADPTHRWAVLLTSARIMTDPVTGTPVTRITWSAADALPFPLCISSTTDVDHHSQPVPGVSVAHGNVVRADHGVWIAEESLGTVPAAPPAAEPTASCSCGTDSPAAIPLPRFHPRLAQSPLTFSVPFGESTSAAAFLAPGSSGALPDIDVQSDDEDPRPQWTPKPDLLSSHKFDRVFVPEIEHDGSVHLRFGDDQYGMAAHTGVSFSATYRVGNGTAGNIGRDTLAHAVLPVADVTTIDAITGVRNPLAATGGVDPEDMAHIRQFAPFAYESQLRCVTEADYGQKAAETDGVAAARGTLRWTGSWYTAFASIEPNAAALTTQIIDETTTRLHALQMMGTDLAVEAAVIVGLRIELDICVDARHFQSDVYQALMKVFITGDQCEGGSGLLNAAKFTFGQTVYASPLVAAAQAVEGVTSVTLAVFTRMDAPWIDGVAQGFLTMGRLDIPRCDNDPNHLDRGIFLLHMDGGK
jgi:Baseplate J-like protein